MKSSLATSFFALSLATLQAVPLAVEEARFLEKPFDFCPPEERAMDERLLEPPKEPFPFPEARFEVQNGVNSIVIGGTTVPSIARTVLGISGAPVERLLRESGVRLFIIDVALTADYFEKRLLENAPHDAFAQFEKRASELLKAVPDALLFVRLWMSNVNEDYVEMHPNGLLTGENGETDWGGKPVPAQAGHTRRPNMLNEWRRFCGEHLRRFLLRLGDSPYADRVGGFYVGAMNTGEWWYYKGKGDPAWDYSSSRKAAFERFVLAKYGTREAIAGAWKRSNDELLLRMPTLAERGIRPLLPNTPAVDYLQVLNQPVTNAAIYFAKIIKAVTSGRSLVGMELHIGGMTYATNGTVFLNHLLDAPEIDFFGGPSEYRGREPGNSPLYRVVYSSLAEHGKFWMNEGDYRTHIAYDTRPGAVGEATRTPKQTDQVFLREYARGVAFNYMTYLMDFAWVWYHDLQIKQSVTRLLDIDRFVRKTGVRRAPEIALVTDQESQLFGNYFANPTSQMLDGTMDQVGAPWAFYELRDILKPGAAAPFKLIVFLNIRSLADHERAAIEKLKSDGRVLLWLHDPGVIDLSNKGTEAADLMSRLIGIRMESGTEPRRITLNPAAFEQINAPLHTRQMEITEEESRKTKTNYDVSVSDTSEGLPIGNVPSRYYCVDEAATILGTDSAGRGFIAAREYPEWTSVYAPYCRLAPDLVRVFARKAGCHIWSHSNDILFATENYVALHAATTGRKEIHLPMETGVLDLATGDVLSLQTKTIVLDLEEGETRFFHLGNAPIAKQQFDAERAAKAEEIEHFKTVAAPTLSTLPFFNNHKPKPPKETGNQPLSGLKQLLPAAYLVAGPFPSDPQSVEALDARLAGIGEIMEWRKLPLKDSSISRKSDTFLQITSPLPLSDPGSNTISWYGVSNAYSWMSQEKVGMANGQTYAVAFHLQASEPTTVRLCVDTVGETAIWLDSQPIAPDSLVQLNDTRKRVVIRIKGGEAPTGFGGKIFDGSAPNSVKKRLPPPNTVTTWFPQEALP